MIIKANKSAFTNEKNLLFLHGYLADKRSFFNQLKFFERDFNVFALDLKGFGENTGMVTPYSLDDYILEVEEFKQKSSISSPHIIAHSFGARIAIKATAKNNNFCSKLVLTGAAGLKPRKTLKKSVKKATFTVLKKFIKKEKLACFYSKDYLALDKVMQESFIKIVNEHLDEYLTFIKNPTLLVFGENDLDTPLYMAKRLNKGIVDSRLVVIEDAGHFCFIDKPHKFNGEVKEFLLS